MKISNYISKLLVAGILLIATGCEKFVEQEDPSNLTPGGFYTTPEHAEAAIAAAYAQTRFINGGAGIFVNNFQLLEAVTGTAKTETGQNSDLNNLLGLGHNGDNLLIRNWWNGIYSVVAQANLVLERVPAIDPMDQAQKSRILGEARFLRAWAYFYAVRLWGDIPLLTSPINSATDPNLYPARVSQEIVYDTIVNDLLMAEAAGLPWSDAVGRASAGAVKTLLSRVYLTMAGYPLQRGDNYYQLAAEKAKDVIDNGPFDLYQNYTDLHTVAGENKVEHIWQIQYQTGIENNPNQGILLPNFKGISKYGTEIGSIVPTTQFYNSYEAGDKRAMDRVGYFYTSYYNEGSGALKDLSAPYIFKHFDVDAHGTAGKEGTAASSLNWNQIRFAETLLLYAEAQNEANNGPDQGAYDALKSVRDRAGLTTPAIGTFNETSFREAVWRERWHELAYEGITWFDMVRLRKVYNEATNGFDEFVGHKFPDNQATLQEKHLLFPLPTAEMQNNPNLTPQNPGF
jgi:starch-binding outer membrane protein, SusD/RagB family